MEVTVEVLGEGERTIVLDSDGRHTYADLLDRLEWSPQEVAVLVDGRPVPEDAPIEADRVRILRLIQGGSRRR